MRTRSTSAQWAIAMVLASSAAVAAGKVVRGTQQGTRGQQNINDANGNDLSNARAATPEDDALAKASAALDVATEKARAIFEQTPAWTDAATAYDQARTARDNDTATVIRKLAADPTYAAAVAARDKAQADLDAMHASATAQPDDVVAAAKTALAFRSAVTAMQSQAVAADPAVSQDRTRFTAALKTMNDLREKEQQAVEADPDWQSAKKTYDAAKTAADASHQK